THQFYQVNVGGCCIVMLEGYARGTRKVDISHGVDRHAASETSARPHKSHAYSLQESPSGDHRKLPESRGTRLAASRTSTTRNTSKKGSASCLLTLMQMLSSRSQREVIP